MFRFIFLVSILFSRIAFSGEFELWHSTSLEQKISDKSSAYGEFIYRHSDANDELKVLSTRLGVFREFENKWKAGLILENRTTDNQNNNEFRNIFQVSKKFDFENAIITTRVRWELRRFSDSQVFLNRFRLFARADLVSLKFSDWTPYLSAEELLITNKVTSRPAGSNEFRTQLGLSTEALGGTIDLAYMFREQIAPSQGSTSKKYSMYHIFNTSLKFTF